MHDVRFFALLGELSQATSFDCAATETAEISPREYFFFISSSTLNGFLKERKFLLATWKSYNFILVN